MNASRLHTLLSQARHYPFLLASAATGVVVGGLLLAGQDAAAFWLLVFAAGVVVIRQSVLMIRSFRSGAWGVDLLAIIAIGATVLTRELVAAAIILVMLTGGEAIQDYAERRARAELTALLRRAPTDAHLVVGDGVRDVPVDQLQPGDVVEVQPGETVPVDGVLLSAGLFDQSSITGESLPVDHAAGSSVMSGSVNGEAAVQLRATATAARSQLATIIDLVAAAADSRAPFVRLADRFAIPFTAVALAIGAVAWIVSGSPTRFAEVLVVATPCPLLIAAPVAFIAGTNRAARAGLIVKSGAVLEQLSRVRTVALDKTGTLTAGTPRVVRVEPRGDRPDLLGIAAAVETHSTHLLADAIVAAADEAGTAVPPAVAVREVPGMGATGIVNGATVSIGKQAFVEQHAEVGEGMPLAAGETAVFVAIDGRYAGRIVLRDELRHNAPRTLDRLRELGVQQVMMLTGDGRETAEAVARDLGITDVRAALLPADKVDAVRRAPHPVMMVGDGVNDAPVLAAADVGVAMGARGATAASESADVVVLVDDLAKVPEAVSIARRTVRIALQSAWVGVGVSVVLMGVAAFGVLPAFLGALLQEGLDIVVIVNGLRATRPGRWDQRP